MKSLTVTDNKRSIRCNEGGEWEFCKGFSSRYELIGFVVSHFSDKGKRNLIKKCLEQDNINYADIKIFMENVFCKENVSDLIGKLAERCNMDIGRLKLIWQEVYNIYEKIGFLEFEMRRNKMIKGINKISNKVPDNVMVRLDKHTGGTGNRT